MTFCAHTGTRNPRWVIERINKDTANGDGDRQYSDFYEDKDIPALYRPRLADYRGSGYDRGHLVPATDHKGSQAHMDSTFSLTNISPQVGKGFNRDYWARFEKYVRDLTKSCSDVRLSIYFPFDLPNAHLPHGWIEKLSLALLLSDENDDMYRCMW